MKLEIKSISTGSFDGDLPPDPEDCWVNVAVGIGAPGEDGEDTFHLSVCTPRSLATAVEESPRFGHGLLIVRRFDWDVVKTEVESLLTRFDGKNWEEVAAKLNRYMAWEFSDYDPTPVA